MTDIHAIMIISRVSARGITCAQINPIDMVTASRRDIYLASRREAPPPRNETYNSADRFSHLSINLIDAAAPVCP